MYSKYRVWIVADKKMYDVVAMHYLADEGGFARVFPRKEIDEKSGEPFNYLMDNEQDRAVLMEFTGFVDSTDTAIYTGDILVNTHNKKWVAEKSDGLFYLTPENFFGEKGHFNPAIDVPLYSACLEQYKIESNICEKHLSDL